MNELDYFEINELDFIGLWLQWIEFQLAWTGPYYLKCLEMTIVVIWRYINKTELNWIEVFVFVILFSATRRSLTEPAGSMVWTLETITPWSEWNQDLCLTSILSKSQCHCNITVMSCFWLEINFSNSRVAGFENWLFGAGECKGSWEHIFHRSH